MSESAKAKPELGVNPKDLIGTKKPPLDLIPPALEIHVAMAMKDGAKKYEPFNWRGNKVRARVYIGAAKRHIAAWMDGEECAQDSGVHHLGHAAACLGIILDAQETGNLHDDRPRAGAASAIIARLTEKPPTA
jgi:hypothetical protein